MAAAKTTTKKEEIKLDIPLKGVYAKLQAARVALMDKGLKKSGKNDFAHFEFFQLVDFLPETQKIFTKLGLSSNYTITPRVIAYIEKTEGEQTTKEPIIRDIARLIIRDIETNDIEIFEMEAAPVQIGNNTKQNIYQAAGGRSTYYKRYLYRDALEIEESDESDTVLGAPDTNYQTPQEVTPYQFETPQPTTIQQDIVMPAAQNNVGQPVVIDNTGDIVVSPDDILSQNSREEIMNVIVSKGLQGFEVINNYCVQNGIGAPNELKEKDKAGLLAYVNSL